MAPFVPVRDRRGLWQRRLVAGAREHRQLPDSVHLRAGPRPTPRWSTTELGAQVAQVRRLVDLGRQARAESRTKTRQPLGRALVSAPGWQSLPAGACGTWWPPSSTWSASEPLAGDLVDTSVKGNFRALGKRFGKRTATVAAAIAAADAAALAAALREGPATVAVDGEHVEVTADEVLVTETPRTGWAVATRAGETVALDLEITPELRRAGLVRDAVRLVQEGRKASGLDVSDRIELWWSADGELAEALREGGGPAGRGGAGGRR